MCTSTHVISHNIIFTHLTSGNFVKISGASRNDKMKQMVHSIDMNSPGVGSSNAMHAVVDVTEKTNT